MHARLLQHVHAHLQIRVPVPSRIGAVRADAADLGCEVERELRPRVVEQPSSLALVREVVVAPARDKHVVSVRPQPLDQV